MKRNLLFYGTTDYGEELSNSDKNKFKELGEGFENIFVLSQGNQKNIESEYVKIIYSKKTNSQLLNYLNFYFLNFIFFKNFIKENNIDVVSAKDPISALIPTLLKKTTKNNFKLIIEHHGNFLDLLLTQKRFYFKGFITFFLKLISNFTYQNCDIIRGVHKDATLSIAEKYDKNYTVFPAWVDNKTFISKKISVPRKNILFVGNVIPRKGVLFLIKAFGQFTIKTGYQNKFLIVGDHPNIDYSNICRSFIANNKINNIEFLMKKSPSEIAELMNNSELLVMASSFEGLPRVLIESGLCNLPSISSDINGISTPFGSEGGTMLYEENNLSDLTSALNKFYEDSSLREKMAEQSFSLSIKLSGEGKFLESWKNLESILYEK